jgi:hypothetical protein
MECTMAFSIPRLRPKAGKEQQSRARIQQVFMRRSPWNTIGRSEENWSGKYAGSEKQKKAA